MILGKVSPLALLFPFCIAGSAWAGAPSQSKNETEVFGAKAWTEASYTDKGDVDTVSVFLPLSSIRNASHEDMQSFVISLPESVTKQSFFHYVGLDWNPHGHPPMDVYTQPHFDIHFFHPSVDEVHAVDCLTATDPAAADVPAGYVLPPAKDPEGCVPAMGVHAAPASDFAPGYVFEETLIYGFYGKQMTFIEPMITRKFMLDKKSATHDIELPAHFFPRKDLMPSRYSLLYDEAKDAYEVRMEGFRRLNQQDPSTQD